MRSLSKNEKEPVKVNTAVRNLQTDLTAAQTDIAGKQPLDADLTAIASLTTNAAGRSVLTLTDPGADRIIFWDDSETTVAYLTPGTGLAISTTNLNISTVPVANGGTGQTTEAEAIGEMTQALTEDTTPDRQLDMAAVYDASADTGKKVALYNVSGCAVLASGTVTSAATLDISLDGFTQFKIFKLFIVNAAPATDNVVAILRFSDDGGSTFEADASDYRWSYWVVEEATVTGEAANGDGADSEIEMGSVGNSTDENFTAEITIYDPAASGLTRVDFTGHRTSATPAAITFRGSGSMLVAGASTDVRFMFSSGDIASAKYTLVGFI